MKPLGRALSILSEVLKRQKATNTMANQHSLGLRERACQDMSRVATCCKGIRFRTCGKYLDEGIDSTDTGAEST